MRFYVKGRFLTSVLFYISHCFLLFYLSSYNNNKRAEIWVIILNDLSITAPHLCKYKPIFLSEGVRNLSLERDELRVDILRFLVWWYIWIYYTWMEDKHVGFWNVTSWIQECFNGNANSLVANSLTSPSQSIMSPRFHNVN